MARLTVLPECYDSAVRCHYFYSDVHFKAVHFKAVHFAVILCEHRCHSAISCHRGCHTNVHSNITTLSVFVVAPLSVYITDVLILLPCIAVTVLYLGHCCHSTIKCTAVTILSLPPMSHLWQLSLFCDNSADSSVTVV